MKGNSLMEWVVKLIFLLMLLPFLICLGLQVLSTTFQMFMVFLAAILPWIIGFAVLTGLVAGVSAGLVMRQRRPPSNGGNLPPGGAPPVKRPRGPGRDDED
jgi:hypothetical protein